MGPEKKAGYTPADIQAAVIMAIKPGSSLRNYVESREGMEDKAFIQVLRSHYIKKKILLLFFMKCLMLSSYPWNLSWISAFV